MSEPLGEKSITAYLASAYVVQAGRIEATVNLPRQSVRFIVRDDVGLERGSVEMFLSEWAEMASAIVKVSEKLAGKLSKDEEASDV